MQEGGARQPRHQRGIFHRVPSPVAAPAEHGIGPMRPEQNASALEAPGDHRPLARDVNPLLTRIAAQQRKWTDRKSTRLNSSHLGISYAVFCLKKKKTKKKNEK